MKVVLRWVIPYALYVFMSDCKRLLPLLKDFGFSKIDLISFMIYYYEIKNDRNFHDNLNKKLENAKSDGFTGGGVLFEEGYYMYALIRLTKPSFLVETGVGPGLSTEFILSALNKNNQGELVSIDLPGNDEIEYPKVNKRFDIHIPKGYEVGWLVSSYLKDRWQLILGDAKIELPKLLEKQQVDFFFHDSLHTDEHMSFEYNCVLGKLSSKGIISSHDVNKYWSESFVDFCIKNKRPYGIYYSYGFSK